MEPLRLLQFWHIPSDKNPAATGDSDTDTDTDITSSPSEAATTTTTNDIAHYSVETDEEDSFFDLDFTVPLKKKQKDYNLPKARSPQPKLRLHMLLKSPEESEKKTEASKQVLIFSLLNIGNTLPGKFQKQRSENASTTRAKRFPRMAIQKYLRLINPFYPRASRKACNRTVRSMTTTNEVSKKTTPFSSPRKQVVEKQRIFVAREHLGKSRSVSSSSSAGLRPVPSRRDDSLLLQHDGIQSAILHCKRSYNSSSSTGTTCSFFTLIVLSY